MALTGTRKAAMLLMSLDPASAAELLKAAKPDAVAQIAAEMAYLRQASQDQPAVTAEPLREFVGMMMERRSGRDFLTDMLSAALGESRSKEVLGQVRLLAQARDPFLTIRQAPVAEVAKALKGESAAVAALVLSELPPRKAAELLPLMDEQLKSQAVRGMTAAADVAPEARLRVAAAVIKRLEAAEAARKAAAAAGIVIEDVDDGTKRRQQLRKVAVLLRGLAQEMRDALLKVITEQDKSTGEQVRKLMVTWEDVPNLPDRPMQEILRKIDSKKLAISLVKADAQTVKKVRNNISERAASMLDEETSLLSSPKAEDINSARETILDALREMNNQGQLAFAEDAAT